MSTGITRRNSGGTEHTVSFRTNRTERPLILNSGFSSIKFAVFRVDESPERVLVGKTDRIGLPGTVFVVESTGREIAASNQDSVGMNMMDWLDWNRLSHGGNTPSRSCPRQRNLTNWGHTCRFAAQPISQTRCQPDGQHRTNMIAERHNAPQHNRHAKQAEYSGDCPASGGGSERGQIHWDIKA